MAFITLALHWFNPMCYLAFFLMSRDMEMSCDEWVLSRNNNIKKQYSTALLSFATDTKLPPPSMLCFGEDQAKSRIKNILSFKKPTAVVSAVAIILCIVIAAVCIANPTSVFKTSKTDELVLDDIADMNIGAEMPQIIFADDEKIIFDGTCGIITFDYKNRKITDRIHQSVLTDELEWTEEQNGLPVISCASEDGKSIFITRVDYFDYTSFEYCYDTDKKVFKRIKNEAQDCKTYLTENINEYNSEYAKYIDRRYITGNQGALVSNNLMYLRATDDWSMKSLSLVICDTKKGEINEVIPIFIKSITLANTVKSPLTKSDFDKLTIGKNTLEDVQKIDPDGDYMFLNTGKNDLPRESLHRTNYGYFIKITYNDDSVITRIETDVDADNTVYYPFSISGEYVDINDYAFSGTLKNESGSIFRIVDTTDKNDKKSDIQSKSIQCEYGDGKSQIIFTTNKPDLNLLAYSDKNIFFSAGDCIYRIKLTYKDDIIYDFSYCCFVYFGQYSITEIADNNITLTNGKDVLYLNTKSGSVSTCDIAKYKPEFDKEKAENKAISVFENEVKRNALPQEFSGIELCNSNELSSEINKNGNPLYRAEFQEKESGIYYHIYIDAKTGEFVYTKIIDD